NNDGINYLTKQPDEILVEVRLPAPNGWDAVYHKLRRRGSFDFPVLGVAAWIRWEQGAGSREQIVKDARIVLGGVASYPQDVPEAGAALKGMSLGAETIAAAAEAAYRPSKPINNTDFDLSWPNQMTRVFVTRALGDLRYRARTSTLVWPTWFGSAASTTAVPASSPATLAEDGKLRWAAPGIAYVPCSALSAPFAPRALTSRDLPVHRSGLARGAGALLR